MIVIKNLYFSYNDGPLVLKNISLVIREGERLAIMGENGAGKTTLIKHLNGLLKPKKGEVIINGQNTKETSVSEISRVVGLVFQNPDHQIFAETVEEEIAFALKNFGFSEDLIKERVEWALNVMDLIKYRKRSPITLSGGERKRVAIASVLSYNPQIIVLDEPTVGQDYFQKQKIAEIIRMLSILKKTIIVVTHDIEFVAENFPRSIVISKGEVIADGKTEDILTDPEVINRGRLLPPQVAETAWYLKNLGFSQKIITVSEFLKNVYDILNLSSSHS